MEEKKDKKTQEPVTEEAKDDKLPLSEEELKQVSGGGDPNNGHRR